MQTCGRPFSVDVQPDWLGQERITTIIYARWLLQ
jgi:hypothetical protein